MGDLDREALGREAPAAQIRGSVVVRTCRHGSRQHVQGRGTAIFAAWHGRRLVEDELVLADAHAATDFSDRFDGRLDDENLICSV